MGLLAINSCQRSKLRSTAAMVQAAQNKQEGQRRMDDYHQSSMDLLDQVLKPFKYINTYRALDLGCGVGNLTKDFLSKRFDKVDMVELDKDDFEKALELKKTIPQIDRVECVDM